MSEEPIKPDPEKKPKRPRDANQLAKLVSDIATGDTEDSEPADDPASEAQREGGKKGGRARAEKLTAEQRSEIARKAARSRWDESAGET